MTALRIASLLAGGTEILYGLGLGDRVVAVSHECDCPPEVANKPRVTFSNVDASASSSAIDDQVRTMVAARQPLYRIDVERLADLKPDLIVTQAQCDVCAVDYKDVAAAVAEHPALRDTRIVALNPTTLNGILDDIRRVADAAGCSDTGERYVAGLRQHMELVHDQTRGLAAEQRPRALCLEWVDPPMAAANWMPDLIDLAGGRCPLTRAGSRTSATPWGDILAFDPEVILIMPCGFELERAVGELSVCRAFPGWNELSAVRIGRVFAADGNALFNRSGPRIVNSLELLAGLFHPQLFPRFLRKYARAWSFAL